MKRLVWVVLGLGAVIVGGGCDRREARQRRFEQREHQWQNVVSAFAARHGATEDWADRLPRLASLETTFSIDVSRALMSSNSKPVLLMTYLEDVAERGGTYTAKFSQSFPRKYSCQLSLELKCTPEQASRLLSTRKTLLVRYALVAHIQEVSRPRFEVAGSWDGEMSSIELSGSPDVFLVKGVCVDFLREEKEEPNNK